MMSRYFGRRLASLTGLLLTLPRTVVAEEPPAAPAPVDQPAASGESAEAPAPPAAADAAPPETPSAGAAETAGRSLRSGPPSPAKALDLCALKSHAPEGTYRIQRVVVVNSLVDSNVVDPETETDAKGNAVGQHTTLASIKAGELTRLLFAAGFPMQRLYTVYSPALATAALFDKGGLTAADLADVTGGDGFVAYSAGCADWVLVPKIARSSAGWRKVKKKKTVVQGNTTREVEYLAWDFSVGFKLDLALFKRGGDGSFAKYKVLSNDGVEGIFAGGGAAEPHSIPFHDYASTWPDASCSIGQPEDGRAGGIASCQGLEPKLSAELEPAAASSLCQDVDDAVGSSMAKIAGCGVANAMDNAVRVLQLHAKQDPWGMFTSLGPELGISLGRREGAKRGDFYVAASRTGHGASGFARIVTLGPGGEDGSRYPSRVKFKTGDADVGSRMTEFPLMGVHVGAHPAFMYVLANGDLDTHLAYGGVVSLGYDASSYIPLLDEFWARVDLGYLAGTSSEAFIPIDLGLQAGTFVASGLTLDLGLGFSALVVSKEVKTSAAAESWSGVSSGLFARAALAHAFSPDWDVAFGLEARSGFSNAKLASDQHPGIKVSAGPMAGALALLSLGHTF
jgi:hypothetical protein